MVDYLARLIIGVPMVVLSAISKQRWPILALALFVLAFALISALAAFKLSNQEFVGAVAAHTAVLVVFVSNTLPL